MQTFRRHGVSTEQCMFIKQTSICDSEFVWRTAYFSERISMCYDIYWYSHSNIIYVDYNLSALK